MDTVTKTCLPFIADQPYFNSFEVMNKFSDYFLLVSDIVDVNKLFFEFHNASSASDFATKLTTFFTQLQQNIETLDNEYIIEFLKRYYGYADTLKSIINDSASQLPILAPVSDSIGCLTNLRSITNETVIPLNDFEISMYPAPLSIPVTAQTKVRNTSLNIAEMMSVATTALHRRNLINLQQFYALNSEAHGSNLITDFTTYTTRKDICTELATQLSTDFASIFKLVAFYSTINDNVGYNPGDQVKNQQNVLPISYTTNVEGKQVIVDITNTPAILSRKTATNKQILANNITKFVQKPVKAPKQFNSKLPVPLNSTAVITQSQTVQAIQPPVLAKPSLITPTTAPTSTLVASKQQALSTPLTPSVLLTTVTAAVPEFSRTPYSNAGTSPMSTIQSSRNILCTLKGITPLTLPKLGNSALPKLPNFFKNFSLLNTGNSLKSLFIKTETEIVNRIKGLIPSIPKIPNLKQTFIEYAKKLCACNPGNKT